ncbi:hypothetical protein [Saccharopolyspora endophytica]|uniref:SdpI family protein n=1 Tax=Saccharopolyspora endophytica TaxID=543886 RepID=A0ABS5DEA3_9PSEU|nr:hypothetical protein [Saccharopolyspora endophytica]MBQ0924627.1 hypothetical protein [Saccharopolyspora endophytica]
MTGLSPEWVIVAGMLGGAAFVAFSKPLAKISARNAKSYYKNMSYQQADRWMRTHQYGFIVGGSLFVALGVLYFSGLLPEPG